MHKRLELCSLFETADQGIGREWLSEQTDRAAGRRFALQIRFARAVIMITGTVEPRARATA